MESILEKRQFGDVFELATIIISLEFSQPLMLLLLLFFSLSSVRLEQTIVAPILEVHARRHYNTNYCRVGELSS